MQDALPSDRRGLVMRTRASLALLIVAAAVTGVPGAQAPSASRELTNPAAFSDTAPETFRAVFDTTAGIFIVRVTRAWAPR